MEFFYRKILKRAWAVSWKNKWLWIFGLFAAIVGNGSVYQSLLRGFSNIDSGYTIFDTMREYSASGVFSTISFAKIAQLWQADATMFGSIIFSMLFILCVLALLFAIGIISQGSLIFGLLEIDTNKPVNLRTALRSGKEHFWRIFGLNLFTKIFLLSLLILLAYLISLIITASSVVNMIIYIVSFLLFFILGMVIYFITIYGTSFVVLRNRKVFPALRSAFDLFRKDIIVNLEMALILFIVNFIFLIIFFIGAFVLSSPFLVLYFLFAVSGIKIGALLASSLLITIVLAMFVVVGAWWSTFQVSVWTILFDQLTIYGGKSKIIRIIENIKSAKKKKQK